MSKLDKLICELCPNGVEYRALGDVCKLITGATPSKKLSSYWNDGTIPWMSSGEVSLKRVWSTEAKITQLAYDKTSTTLVPPHSIVIALAGQGKTRGKVAITEIELCTNQSLCSIVCSNELDYKFLYYYLDGKYEELRSISNGDGSRGGLSLKILSPYKIPVPPLDVQREIVRILDDFTEQTEQLKASLTAELTARKRQYEYYRDKLLALDVFGGRASKCERRTLGDIAKFTYGYTDKAKNAGDVRFIRITDINDSGYLSPSDAKYIDLTEESKKYLLKKGDLLLARTGATYGKTLFFDSDEPAVYASFLIRIVLDNAVIRNRYYWHFSKSSLYWEQAEKYVSKGGQQQFNANAISRVKIPIPSLEVQDRIINVLDNFDAICSDLNIGLPAEIEARQKQYEYYRDKLLTFKERIST